MAAANQMRSGSVTNGHSNRRVTCSFFLKILALQIFFFIQSNAYDNKCVGRLCGFNCRFFFNSFETTKTVDQLAEVMQTLCANKIIADRNYFFGDNECVQSYCHVCEITNRKH